MTDRVKATWTVFELITSADVFVHGRVTWPASAVDGEPRPLAENATVLVEVDTNVVARTGADACWHVAETALVARATSDNPPVLTASRNGTSHGLTEARPYPLKTTVERVK